MDSKERQGLGSKLSRNPLYPNDHRRAALPHERNRQSHLSQGGYGYAETQVRQGPWVCINFESGETIFQSAPLESSYKYKNGCLTYADGMFYLYSDNGNMALAKPADTGFEVTGRLKIEDPGERPTWAHPVVFGRRLYLRYGDKLGAYRVAEGSD